jgi:hypothetical protein
VGYYLYILSINSYVALIERISTLRAPRIHLKELKRINQYYTQGVREDNTLACSNPRKTIRAF